MVSVPTDLAGCSSTGVVGSSGIVSVVVTFSGGRRIAPSRGPPSGASANDSSAPSSQLATLTSKLMFQIYQYTYESD